MPVAVGNAYSVASGQTIYAGRSASPLWAFDSVADFSDDGLGQAAGGTTSINLSLHASGGGTPGGTASTVGKQYRATCSGALAYDTHTQMVFGTARTTVIGQEIIRPVDYYGGKESAWRGFKDMPLAAYLYLITDHRLDALVEWIRVKYSSALFKKLTASGGSMGAWGCMTFAMRRGHVFAAVYADRPKWGPSTAAPTVNIQSYTGPAVSFSNAAAPALAPGDGTGNAYAHANLIAHVADTANKIPWLGWCIGRQDGFATFAEQIEAVAMLRAAKRGFCFVWNNGDHSTGSIIAQVYASYPFGTFSTDKGYPLFTEHSGDQDPSIDLIGGINEGLSFRNVVESAGAWSCEVASIAGARTVKVEPISSVFLASVAKQTVTIPAANSWVAVSFSA